jgi:hypothetical protein
VGEDHKRKGKEMISSHDRAQSTNHASTRRRSGPILAAGALLATVLPIALVCQGCLFPIKPRVNTPNTVPPPLPSTPITEQCLCGTGDHEWGQQGTELQGTAIPTTCQGKAVRIPVTSFSLRGIRTASGASVANARVNGGQLVGFKADGAAMVPNDWVNVEFSSRVQCTDSDDTWAIRARIKGIVSPSHQASQGGAGSGATPVYDVELLDARGGQGNWIPACKDGERAVPFSEVWNVSGGRQIEAGSFTFACLNAAIGKCYNQWGYVPWKTTADGVNWTSLHQACTRMARADYCGDGTPHTVDNHPVDVWDSAGMLRRSSTTPGGVSGTPAFEGAWNDTGALCFNHFRISGSETNCQNKNVPTGATSIDFGIAKCTSDETAKAFAGSAPLIFNASVPPTP